MIQPERLMDQMYTKYLENQTSTVYSYVGLTSRIDLMDNIIQLSPKANKVVLYTLRSMTQRPFVEPQQMWQQMLVTYDWELLGLKDRGYKSRVISELKSIGFMTKYKKDSYLINLHYINPFSKLQHQGFVLRIQASKYLR